MEIVDTGIEGLLLIKPKFFGDERGYFMESYQVKRYQEFGINTNFVQDNISRSQKGVLRGLHFQIQHAQDKLVMVSRGQVFDVAVDVRPNSPTFGRSYGVILNDQNHWQLFIPKGFAHGFYVMENKTDFCYKCSDYYHPEDESGILWNDPDLKIDWPLDQEIAPIVSAKDQLLPRLREHITKK
jgi:dTDP-4-dehydrorhamnose 3,5-epimerase